MENARAIDMIAFATVCSGIEAPSVALGQHGWQAEWFSEIEPFPCALLEHRYSDTKDLGDMTGIAKMVRYGEASAPDVFIGGTPCQAFSVAGLRNGLSDERGFLTISFVEIADAIDDVRLAEGKAESVIWWENVPGVLSSKDNAFGCFLGALAGESCELQPPGRRWENAGCVYGPKRAIAWRVLDAQYFGLAQRRKRVFVVASARDGLDPAKVLFEFDGVRRDSAPRREARQEVAENAGDDLTESSLGGHSEGVGAVIAGTQNDYFRDASVNIAPTLRSGSGGGVINQAVATQAAVRRLTPVECERLMGFPDGYTAIPWRNKPAEECPDGHRYRALGNSMAVPCMSWLGRRIQEALRG